MRKAPLLLIFLCTASAVVACPMCKDSKVNNVSDQKSAVTESASLDFNKSIYFMLGGFITVVGFTGRVMYKAAKSA